MKFKFKKCSGGNNFSFTVRIFNGPQYRYIDRMLNLMVFFVRKEHVETRFSVNVKDTMIHYIVLATNTLGEF